VPAPRADRVPLLDQRLDLGLDHVAIAIAIGLLEVELVQPVPNLGQPGAFLGREWWDSGGHDPLSCTFSDYLRLTQLAEREVKIDNKIACFQSPTARTLSRSATRGRRIVRQEAAAAP